MAIEYKLINTTNTNYTSNRVYLKDSSVYSTPTDRASIALVVQGVYKSSKGDRNTILDRHDPLTATSFTALIAADGWYKFNMYALPLYDASKLSSYAVGDIYYSVNDTAPVIIVTFGNGKRSRLVDINTISPSYIVSSVDTLSVANNTKVMLKLNGLINDLLTNNVDLSNKKLIRLKGNYDTVRLILQGSIYEYARGNKSVCQKNLEFLNTNDYTNV